MSDGEQGMEDGGQAIFSRHPSPVTRHPLPRLGLELPIAERRGRDDVPSWAVIAEMARAAEEVGFDSVWVEDHLLLRPEGEAPQGLWDGWSILCGLAAVTSRITLGSFVTCTAF